MTSAEMLSRLRMMLDRSANDGFLTDAGDLYPALTDGQKEAFKILYTKNPEDRRLQILMKDATASAISVNYVAMPADMWENYLLVASWAKVSGQDKKYCDIKVYNKELQYILDNSYKTPVTSRPLAYIKSTTALGNRIYFEPSGSSSDYEFTYLTIPTDIDASTQPQITDSLRYAVVLFAFQSILRKQKMFERADAELKNFIGLVNDAG